VRYRWETQPRKRRQLRRIRLRFQTAPWRALSF
jgi:hypothetical protein